LAQRPKKQILMGQVVKQFLNQRLKSKKDSYSEFNHKDIKLINNIKMEILKDLIYQEFTFEKYFECRELIERCFKKFGFHIVRDFKIYLRYLLSFFPASIIRKIIYYFEFIRRK